MALLLFLQQHQHVTAAQAAAELEVSERTARRDLEALCMAGLPVYSERGRGGGWRLLGGGRTDLSGLTGPEARALFLVAGPAAGTTPELKAALRKLVRALPESFRAGAEAAAATVVVDQASWGQPSLPGRPPAHLAALQEAAAGGAEVLLGYSDRSGRATLRVVHPLGLARKGMTWYLVAATEDGTRTFRVSRVRSVETTGARVARPEGFDLATEWHRISDRVEEMRAPAEVSLTARADLVPVLRWVFGGRTVAGQAGTDGRVPVRVAGHSAELIAAQLAGFGDGVEVTGPEEARSYLERVGRELVALYGGAR